MQGNADYITVQWDYQKKILRHDFRFITFIFVFFFLASNGSYSKCYERDGFRAKNLGTKGTIKGSMYEICKLRHERNGVQTKARKARNHGTITRLHRHIGKREQGTKCTIFGFPVQRARKARSTCLLRRKCGFVSVFKN